LAIAISISSEPIVTSSGLVSGDNDIVALSYSMLATVRGRAEHVLTNANLEIVGSIWDDRHKVVGDDLERVTVEGNTESSVNSRVDDSEAVLLSGRKCNSVVGAAALCVLVGSVNQDVVTSRRCSTKSEVEGTSSSLEGRNVIPILQNIGTEVDIVISSSRTVDLQGTDISSDWRRYAGKCLNTQ
jgi:hypothetical protein